MTLQGRVAALEQAGDEAMVSVEFAGMNSLGTHVMGSATLSLPRA
jgi:hypothetical protein